MTAEMASVAVRTGLERESTASRPVNNRSAVSNGRRMLAGIDGRSARARRFRDFVADFTIEMGGDAALSAAEAAMIRQAAALMLKSEEMQAAIIRGEKVDDEQAVRLANASVRLLRAIRREREQPDLLGEDEIKELLHG